MAYVRVDKKDEQGFEKALKVFKKQCMKEGIIEELKERRYYISKSILKQRKKKEIIGKKLKALRKNKKLY